MSGDKDSRGAPRFSPMAKRNRPNLAATPSGAAGCAVSRVAVPHGNRWGAPLPVLRSAFELSRRTLHWVLRVLVMAAPPHAPLVAPLGCAVEPLVHAPKA